MLRTWRSQLWVEPRGEVSQRLWELAKVSHRAHNRAMQAILACPPDVSPQTHAYRMVRDLCAEVAAFPSGSVSAISQVVWLRYKALKKQIARGDASVPCWRYPAPIHVRAAEWSYIENPNPSISVALHGKGGPGRTIIELRVPEKGRKRRRLKAAAWYYAGLADIQAGKARDLKICWSRRNKCWDALISIETEQPQLTDDAPVVAVHLGMVVPVQLSTAAGDHTAVIGDAREIWRFKERMLSRRQRDSKLLAGRYGQVGGGGARGEKRRNRVRDRSKDSEARWLKTKIQQYAAKVVQQARRMRARAIVLGIYHNAPVSAARAVDMDEREYVEEVTLLWQQYKAIEAVRWAARKAGFEVIDVEEAGCSMTCAECGHADPGNRVTREAFKCLACNHENNAEVNAARVLAQRAVVEVAP